MQYEVATASGRVLDYMVAVADGRAIRRDPMAFGIHSQNGGYWIWEDKEYGNLSARIGSISRTGNPGYSPINDWSQGGPIVGCEAPWVRESASAYPPSSAFQVNPAEKFFAFSARRYPGGDFSCYYGSTFLEAAMRCVVASKFGKFMCVPDDLIPPASLRH